MGIFFSKKKIKNKKKDKLINPLIDSFDEINENDIEEYQNFNYIMKLIKELNNKIDNIDNEYYNDINKINNDINCIHQDLKTLMNNDKILLSKLNN